MNTEIPLRRELHRLAEPSGKEERTARRLHRHLTGCRPNRLVTGLGGHGLAAVFSGPDKGPTILLRCELDALAHEGGASHCCGHDGHMAILAGTASILARRRPQRGKVILLFQPAEETGEGALKVLADRRFSRLRPDYAFALHNLPGFPLGTVLLRDGPFAMASKGLRVKLHGRASHAGEPENGRSPARTLAALIRAWTPHFPPGPRTRGFVTVVHARLGSPSFGTSPGEAELSATLRADSASRLDALGRHLLETARRHARRDRFRLSHSWEEVFPETCNDPLANRWLEVASRRAGLSVQRLATPFRWSEDFGHLLRSTPGALFGLGAGESAHPLHDVRYGFPDPLVAKGIRIFTALLEGGGGFPSLL